MKKIVYGAVSFLPVLALAANTPGDTIGGFTTLAGTFKGFVNAVIPVLIALAVVYFFWGLITYIRASGDEKAREAGKGQMIWGVIAIAIMVSLFGLINWLQGAFNLDTTGVIKAPTIQGI